MAVISIGVKSCPVDVFVDFKFDLLALSGTKSGAPPASVKETCCKYRIIMAVGIC